MRKSILYFFSYRQAGLWLLVVLFSCTTPLVEVEPEKEEKEFFEFEGVVEMANDAREIRFGDLDNHALGMHIDLSWELGEQISFASDELEFEEGGGVIVGMESCLEFSYTAAVAATHQCVFKPAANFWECLYEVNCDPEDEVFWFSLQVRFVNN